MNDDEWITWKIETFAGDTADQIEIEVCDGASYCTITLDRDDLHNLIRRAISVQTAAGWSEPDPATSASPRHTFGPGRIVLPTPEIPPDPGPRAPVGEIDGPRDRTTPDPGDGRTGPHPMPDPMLRNPKCSECGSIEWEWSEADGTRCLNCGARDALVGDANTAPPLRAFTREDLLPGPPLTCGDRTPHPDGLACSLPPDHDGYHASSPDRVWLNEPEPAALIEGVFSLGDIDLDAVPESAGEDLDDLEPDEAEPAFIGQVYNRNRDCSYCGEAKASPAGLAAHERWHERNGDAKLLDLDPAGAARFVDVLDAAPDLETELARLDEAGLSRNLLDVRGIVCPSCEADVSLPCDPLSEYGDLVGDAHADRIIAAIRFVFGEDPAA